MQYELWVLSNLQSYCLPGTHDFLPGESPKGSIRWCAVCLKEEPADESGCMVCDLAGRFEVVLCSNEGRQAEGRLCETCYEAFSRGRPLGGWALQSQPQTREMQHEQRRR